MADEPDAVPPAPDATLTRDGDAVHIRFHARPFGACGLLVAAAVLSIALSLALSLLVDHAIGRVNRGADDRIPGVCCFGFFSSALSFVVVGLVLTAVREAWPPRVRIDPDSGRCDIRTYPWRRYALDLRDVRGVEALTGWSKYGPVYWVAVHVEGRPRPVYVRKYASMRDSRADEADAVRAAELLAPALGVPVTRRTMSTWENFTS